MNTQPAPASNWYTALVSGALFPLHERLKGHRSVTLRRQMESTQHWAPEKLDALLRDLEAFGIKEMVQSGVVAIGRGSRSITTGPALRAASCPGSPRPREEVAP